MYSKTLATAELLLIIKNLKAKLNSFENGDAYKKLEEDKRKMLAYEESIIKKLKAELAEARKDIRKNREQWYEVYDDIIKEHEKMMKQMENRLDSMYKKMIASFSKRDTALDELAAQKKENKSLKKQLQEEKEKNKQLTARINKDYTNSSKSSSMDPNHKTIKNSREKSGLRPGGQPGHDHHPRHKHIPTHTVILDIPERYLENDLYKPTEKKIRKQLVRIKVVTEVIEYVADEFRNVLTGQRVHADFPAGVNLDVNYDGTVKAFAYMLNNDCNVSITKVHKFIQDITHGEISISTGCINNLCKEFSVKTAEERNEIYLKLMSSPYMHGDFTFGRLNGKQATVFICGTPEMTLYMGRPKKGEEGIKDTPAEFYAGTFISDHETVLVKCGSRHQECMQHVERYLKGSIENEPLLSWNTRMLEWIKKAIKYWNDVDKSEISYSTETVSEYLKEYDEIIELAKTEYEKHPPGKYYKEGYNLYERMYSDKDDYQLFLMDPSIPPTNNLVERDGRKFKRKAHQVMCFRSQHGLYYFCDGLTILESLKRTGENVYEEVSKIFNRGKVVWI